MPHDKIAVVDFGGQYAHLIAVKLRQLKVLAEICRPEDLLGTASQYMGVVLSGSPGFASCGGSGDKLVASILKIEKPVLGLCFGHHLIAKHYGGKVEHTRHEYGRTELRLINQSPMFDGLPERQIVWMSHGDTVTCVPEGFAQVAETLLPDGTRQANAAIADDRRRRYGLQFHPEVDDTEYGSAILQNFATNVCGCLQTWTMDCYLDRAKDQIRQQAAGRGVFLLVSGGVDSTVCAVLIGQAIGPDRLHLLHVDNGLMRKGESEAVVAEFNRLGLGANLHFVDASQEFFDALKGVADPETKRKAIGDTFVKVFERTASELRLESMMLGQGTIYPDTIETGGSARSEVIKTHHNRAPAVQRLLDQGRVIEPVKDLYKREVRALGEQLRIDSAMLWRHPFPGPGLGVRVLCGNGTFPTRYDPAGLNPIVAAVLEPFYLEGMVMPVKSVGVKGDARCYELPVLVWGKAPFERLTAAASQLYSRVPSVNRCIWNFGKLELHDPVPVKAAMTRERLELAREADAVVMEEMDRFELSRLIWQCPTVLVPLSFNGRGTDLVVIRPVYSTRAMTAQPAPFPDSMLSDLERRITSLPGVSGVVLDITTKPPGTIEWE